MLQQLSRRLQFFATWALVSAASLQMAAAQGRDDLLFVTGYNAPISGTFTSFSNPINQGGGKVIAQANLVDASHRDFGLFVSQFDPESPFDLLYEIKQVVREGDTASNGNGTFDNPGQPFALDFFGTAYFQSRLNGTTGAFTDRGIFQATPDSNGFYQYSAWTRGGDASPAGNGEIYTDFRNPIQGDFLAPLFIADVSGGANGPSTVIVDGSTEIARLGGTVVGANGTWDSFQKITVNGNFLATLSSGGNGVFIRDGAGHATVARRGTLSFDNDGEILSINNLSGSRSKVVFSATLDPTTTSQGTANDEAIFLADTFQRQVIAREGQTVTGIGTFANLSARPIVNSWENVAFRTTLASGNNAIIAWEDGTLRKLTRDFTVGPNSTTIDAGKFAMDERDRTTIAYEGTFGTGGTGLFFTDGDDHRTIAAVGQNFLGSPITLLDFAASEDSLNDAIGFQTGEVAYKATLADGRQLLSNWVPELRWTKDGDGQFGDARNWSYGIRPQTLHDLHLYHYESPSTPLRVTLPRNETTSIHDLQIGGSAPTGAVDEQVILDLNGGRLEADLVFITSVGNIVGNGEIDAVVTRSLGRMAPGNSVGILQVLGDFELGDTSELEIEIGSGFGQYDLLSIGGDFLIDGELEVNLIDERTSFSEGEIFYFASVGGLITGQFDGLAQDGLVGKYDDIELRIDYTAFNGRNISLYTVAVPEPTACTLLVLAGLGLVTMRRKQVVS